MKQFSAWELWPEGVIPYVIYEGFTSDDKAAFVKAFKYMEDNLCLR